MNMFTLPHDGVCAVVLGNMQDGGLPHIGCRCTRCANAFAEPAKTAYAACLAIIQKTGTETAVFLIDATPDIKWQLNLLTNLLGAHPQRPNRLRQPDGIFITHAHMGHVGGLPQLGPEAMAVENLPIYGTAALLALLQKSAIWQPALDGFELRPITAGETIILDADFHLTPIAAPHRDEWRAGTLAFLVQGPHKKLLYLPDIDAWEQWPDGEKIMRSVDFALVDASFFSTEELNGRSPVAHPLIPDTLNRYAQIPGQLFLTHLNHTNPVLDSDSDARLMVMEAGVKIAQTGQMFNL